MNKQMSRRNLEIFLNESISKLESTTQGIITACKPIFVYVDKRHYRVIVKFAINDKDTQVNAGTIDYDFDLNKLSETAIIQNIQSSIVSMYVSILNRLPKTDNPMINMLKEEMKRARKQSKLKEKLKLTNV